MHAYINVVQHSAEGLGFQHIATAHKQHVWSAHKYTHAHAACFCLCCLMSNKQLFRVMLFLWVTKSIQLFMFFVCDILFYVYVFCFQSISVLCWCFFCFQSIFVYVVLVCVLHQLLLSVFLAMFMQALLCFFSLCTWMQESTYTYTHICTYMHTNACMHTYALWPYQSVAQS